MSDAPESAEAEPVLSTIANVTLKAGVLGLRSRQHSLVFTPTRILFARMTTSQMSNLAKQARDEAKARGEGRMAQFAAQAHAFDALAASYQGMTPAQILAQNPDNFAVDRSTVTKVKIKQTGDSSGAGVSTDVLVIKTSGHTYKLTLVSSVGQARQALVTAGLPAS